MNNDKATPDAGDQDLARLFDAQQDPVPEALDKLILTAAKQAVAEPAGTVRRPGGTLIKSWFAVAATLLLGVTLVPLLLQAPESSLDATSVSGSTLNAVEETVSMTTEPPAHELLDSEADVMDFAARAEAPMSVASPVIPAIQAQSRRAVSKSGSAVPEKSVNDEEEYRHTAKSWLEQIRVLIEDKQADRARTEYDLFRMAYPDYAPDFTLETAPD